MKKIMKRLVSVALVLTLLLIPFSYLLNVKALDIATTNVSGKDVVSNTSTVNVTGVGDGDTLGAYKILDALYNKTSNEITYQFTSLFEAFQASEYATNDDKDFSSASFDVDSYLAFGKTDMTEDETKNFELLYTQFAKYVKAQGTSVVASATLTATAGTTVAVASNVAVGSYLILPISTTRIYSAMIANVEIVAEGGAWKLEDPIVVAAKSTAISDVFPSGDDEPGGQGKAKSIISKEIATASVVQGEEYIYIISTPLPTYPTNASNTEFIITETLDRGVEFKGFEKMYISDGVYSDAVAVQGTADGKFVKDGKNIATATSSTKEDGTTTIVIKFFYEQLEGKEVEIHYSAALALGADIAYGTEYRSKSVLTYSVDPYGTATKTTNASVASALTYGFKVNNIKKGDNNVKLVGAKFALYKVDSKGDKTGDPIATAEYKNNTVVFDRGIAATSTGTTYRLVQTAAPAGYTLAGEKSVILNITNTAESFEDGTVYYDSDSKTFTVTVANTEAGLLPATGGLGTILYTLIGLFIITFSATAVVYYRKKKTATNE